MPDKTIEKFPKFSKLDISQKRIFNKYAEKFGHYSDFNFTSIFTWNTDDNSEISMLNENLVIKMPDYITGEECYSILGNTKMDESLSDLLKMTPILKLVPDCTVNSIWNKSNFDITEDEDNHDYIYLVKNLVELKGKQYKDTRNKLSKFKREYSDYPNLKVSTTSIVDVDRYNSFEQVFLIWSKNKNLTDEEFELEQIAINRLLKYSKDLNLLIVEVSLNDQLIAFSINEIVESGYAICHYEKSIKMHEFFNTYLVEQVAKYLDHFGCEKVNWEQDLGLPGLKRSKHSYGPIEKLKKYQIKLAFS